MKREEEVLGDFDHARSPRRVEELDLPRRRRRGGLDTVESRYAGTARLSTAAKSAAKILARIV